MDDEWVRPLDGDEPECDLYEVETAMEGHMKLPFIVATPASYIVDLQHAARGDPAAARVRLVGMVGELRSYLRELGIGEAEAHHREYSLNLVTWDRLYDAALHAGPARDLCARMRAGAWQR